MTVIRVEIKKLQYEINGNCARIPALSSGKIGKYEYLAGEEILPPNQSIVIQQAKYSPLGKALAKQIKTIGEQGKKG